MQKRSTQQWKVKAGAFLKRTVQYHQQEVLECNVGHWFWQITIFSWCTNLDQKFPCADGLNRLPVEHYFTLLPCPEEVVLSISAVDLTPVASKTVAFYMSRDPVLLQVRKWILQKWPIKGSDFQPYTTRKDELSEQFGCVL